MRLWAFLRLLCHRLWAVGILFSSVVALASAWMSPPPLPDVEVMDQDGRRMMFYSDLVRGRTVAINFVFASCTTICPAQTAIFREVRGTLNNAIQPAAKPLMISITVDPWNDQPPQLKQFAKRYDLATGVDAGWVFVTGSEKNIKKILAALDSLSSDRENHQSLVWVGNEPLQRWQRTSGLNPSAHFVQLLRNIAL